MPTMMMKRQTFRSTTALPTDDGLPRLRVTTGDLDRDRDRVIPSGMDAVAFLKNPVLCWGHQHHEVPIGTVTRLDVSGNGVDMTWRWLENDPLADRVRNAWTQGVVRAASIGFMPIESAPNGLGGRDHIRWELTEVSLVAIPSNRNAVKTLKALGLYEEPDDLTFPPPPSRAVALADDDTVVLEIAPSKYCAVAKRAARLAQDALQKSWDAPTLEIEEVYEVDERALKIAVASIMIGAIAAEAAVAVERSINYHRGRVQ